VNKYEKLDKIGKLRESGVLTEDEFVKEKEKILKQTFLTIIWEFLKKHVTLKRVIIFILLIPVLFVIFIIAWIMIHGLGGLAWR